VRLLPLPTDVRDAGFCRGRARGSVAGMPRKATGSIDPPHVHADGRTVTFRARVRAYGRQHRLTFGTNHEGWNDERVRVELDQIRRQIERGTWEPPSREAAPAVMVEDDGRCT
jgi:hypothetical protein